MSSPLLTAILLAMLVVLVGRSLWHSFRRPPAQLVRDWARAHALTLTPANQPVVEYYVATAGRLRAVGVIAGVIVPMLAASAFGFGSTFGFGHIWALLGYLVGAFVAEVTLGRPLPAGRTASLVPRRLTDYLPRRLLVAQRVLAALCVVTAALVPFGADDESELLGLPTSSVGLVLVGLGSVAAAVGLEALQRFLVRRPQPFVTPDLLAADDAIRSQSVHSLSGSGIGVLLLVLGSLAYAREALLPLSLACYFASLFSCLYYGHRAWRVPRSPVTAPG